MKEKIDLSLDNRQVVSVLIGALVVLGAVFVLGVVVGKKLAVSHEAAEAPDLLSALDAQAEAHARTEEDAPALTFPDELTKKTSGAPPASEPSKKPPVVTIDVSPRPTAPDPAAAPATEGKEAPKVADAASKPGPDTRGTSPTPAQSVEQKPALAVSAQKPASAPVATRIVETRTPQPTSASRPAAPAGTAADGNFSLQLSASQSRDEADLFARKLRERGYAPFIVEAEVPGKGTWYRVRMGRFPTKDAASRYLADFRRETGMNAFIAAAD